MKNKIQDRKIRKMAMCVLRERERDQNSDPELRVSGSRKQKCQKVRSEKEI